MNYKILGRGRGPEYFRGIRPIGSLTILGLVVTSCSFEARPTIDPSPSATRARATETYTPTPSPTTLPGTSFESEQLVAFGRAIGAGGPGRLEDPIYNSRDIQNGLIEKGLIPLVDSSRKGSGGQDLLTQTLVLPDGTRVCFPNSPVELFNPEVASGRDEWLFDANFIRYYGSRNPQETRFQTVPVVSLDRLSTNIVCVNTIAMSGRENIFGARPGTVLTVLFDTRTGDTPGAFRSVFAASDALGFDQTTGRLTVNGQPVWFEGPGMLQLTPTPTETPTSTPHPEIRPSDITNEDRLYFRDHGSGRTPVPYGLSYSPREVGPDPEGAKRWLLSGILLEQPQLRETDLVEFRIGIPDSRGTFSELYILQRVLWYRDPSNPKPEDLLYPMLRAPRSPAGGYNMYGKTGETFSLNEGIRLYEGAIGKQIVVQFDFNESQSQMFAYLDNFAQVDCKGFQGCIDLAEELKGHYSEATETFRDIRNSDYSRYDGNIFWVFVSGLVVPRTPSN